MINDRLALTQPDVRDMYVYKINSAVIAEEDFLSSNIVGLDVSAAISRLGGDKKFYLRLLRTFHNNPLNMMINIEEALSSGNTQLALHHANMVKSVAGTLGAIELERLALVLITSVAFDEPSVVKTILARLGAELDRLVSDLSRHLQADQQNGNDLLLDTAANATRA